MSWFTNWWQEIGLLGQIMACAAIPMTVVMFLQLILMIIGVGFGGDSDGDLDSDDLSLDGGGEAEFDAGFDSDFDSDFDSGFDAGLEAEVDVDADLSIEDVTSAEAATHDGGHHGDSMRILTVRGVVAFFALGGWAGLAALTAGIPTLLSIMIALVIGVAAMLVASFVIRFALRMQSSGNIILQNAVSQTAEVYITIPPSRSKTGKVTMVLQERFVELDAVTDSTEALKPKTKVDVVGTAGRDCLVVRAAVGDEKYQ